MTPKKNLRPNAKQAEKLLSKLAPHQIPSVSPWRTAIIARKNLGGLGQIDLWHMPTGPRKTSSGRNAGDTFGNFQRIGRAIGRPWQFNCICSLQDWKRLPLLKWIFRRVLRQKLLAFRAELRQRHRILVAQVAPSDHATLCSRLHQQCHRRYSQ